jgi:hypothetical protein
VHENVFAPVVGGDVARAFRLVEPLDLAFEVGGGGRGAHGGGGGGGFRTSGFCSFVCWSLGMDDLSLAMGTQPILRFVGRLHVPTVVERVFKPQRPVWHHDHTTPAVCATSAQKGGNSALTTQDAASRHRTPQCHGRLRGRFHSTPRVSPQRPAKAISATATDYKERLRPRYQPNS